MPYQCIKICKNVLVAARGSSIDTFNHEVASLLSTWNVRSAQDLETANSETKRSLNGLGTQKSEPADAVLGNSPPAKRRKLSMAEDHGSALEPTPKNGTKKHETRLKKENKRSDAVASGLETPVVSLLAATGDGRHVVAVTGEDKSIRVFQQDLGCLKELSQRVMPKRPCAIAITADDSTIISADKFGDVYSLPLLIPESSNVNSLGPTTPTPDTTVKAFVPAANTLTVHSQRNRKALENQKRHSSHPAEKSEPTFEHKLLLGHVSMLTDLALVTLEGKDYIVTADRDEHIRVSRGIPQAHIIEGFCLGHNEFVSQICIPDSRREVLISGGGDDGLFVWEWAKGFVVSKADLKALVMEIIAETVAENVYNETTKIAVSRIMHVRQIGNDGPEDLVVVACEGVPAVFIFLLTAQNELQHTQTLRVPGNVLDLATDTADGFIVSIDTIHKSGSTTDRREPSEEVIEHLQKFVSQGRVFAPSTIKFESAKDDEEDTGKLTNLLYGLENLRKRDDGREED